MKEIITAEGVSKAYRIGVQDRKSDTMLGAVWHGLKAPFRNFRNLRNLRNLRGQEESVFWALKDINFAVKEGEVLGIIGHNGAGKSTLLKILSRITDPSSGRIVIHGRVSSLLEVGTGFHPDLTGRENIYMNGTVLGMRKKEIDARLEEIISFSGISRHIDTPVKRYSSGMAVRLAFSVAAHLEPEILIVDEVLAVGDTEFQKKCLGKMKDVSSQGRTVLFVSHNMPVIETLCSRILLLKEGRIKDDGPTSQVISKYLKNFEVNPHGDIWVSQDVKKGCYFAKIEVRPESEEYFVMGHNILIKCTLESDFDFSPFQISIKLHDENYNLVTWLFNSDFLISYDLKKGKNEFQFLIKPSNILPGSYYFSFTAVYNYGRQIFDQVENAVKIEIEPKDITGSGRPFLKNRGMVWFQMEEV